MNWHVGEWYKFPNVWDNDPNGFTLTFARNMADCFNFDSMKGYALELVINPNTGECMARLNNGHQMEGPLR